MWGWKRAEEDLAEGAATDLAAQLVSGDVVRVRSRLRLRHGGQAPPSEATGGDQGLGGTHLAALQTKRSLINRG